MRKREAQGPARVRPRKRGGERLCPPPPLPRLWIGDHHEKSEAREAGAELPASPRKETPSRARRCCSRVPSPTSQGTTMGSNSLESGLKSCLCPRPM